MYMKIHINVQFNIKIQRSSRKQNFCDFCRIARLSWNAFKKFIFTEIQEISRYIYTLWFKRNSKICKSNVYQSITNLYCTFIRNFFYSLFIGRKIRLMIMTYDYDLSFNYKQTSIPLYCSVQEMFPFIYTI